MDSRAEETRPLLEHHENEEPADGSSGPSNGVGHGDGSPIARRAFWLMLPGLALGILLMCTDNGLEAAAFVKISSELKNFNHLGWLSISYTLMFLLIQIINARLSDVIGRKPLLLSSYAIFAIGSLLCASITSFWALVVARAVVGLGAGGMGVMVSIILNDIVPLHLRGLWQGATQWVVLLGNLSGSQIGGAIVDGPGWRVAFLIQTPIAIATLFFVLYTLRLPTLATQKPDDSSSFREHFKALSTLDLDIGGTALLIFALTTLTISLAVAGNDVPWDHPIVLSLLPIGLASVICFCWYELRWTHQPLIPVQELRRRDLWSIFGTAFFEDFSFTAFMLYAPIHVRVNEIGKTSTVGLYLSMIYLGLAIGQTIAGALVKFIRIPWMILLGAEVSTAVATILLQARWQSWNSRAEDLVELLLLGTMHGGIKCTLLVQLLEATSQRTQATLYGAWHIFSSIAIIFGSAVFAALVQQRFAIRMRHSSSALPDTDVEEVSNPSSPRKSLLSRPS